MAASGTQDLAGRHAIVTGANAGIGYETALALAQRGARVTLGCRSRERGENALQKLRAAVPQANFELSIVDVGDLDSIRTFADDFRKKNRTLDFLCNNAGAVTVPFGKSPQGFETHMATNCFGPYALTGSLLDVLRATPGSRIVNVSSQIHRMAKLPLDDLNWERRPYDKWKAYAQSKLAVAAITIELDRRLKAAGIDVMAVIAQPGFAASESYIKGPVTRISGVILVACRILVTPADGARPSLYAMTSPDARGADYIGPDNWIGSAGDPARGQASALARDPQSGAALWACCARATGVQYP